jgi:fructose-specific PTS system IIA-like component
MAPEFTFVCPLPNGFHARPASHLASVATDFLSECLLTNRRNGSVANIKSVLSIIAADIRWNDECSVHVHGSDEQVACSALRRFVGKDLSAFDEPLTNFLKDETTRVLPRSLRSAGVKAYFGLPVSRGIARGRTVVIGASKIHSEPIATNGLDPTKESERVKQSVAATCSRIRNKLLGHASGVEAGILQAHLAILGDVSFMDKLLERVQQGRSAARAVIDAGEFFSDLLRRSENPYTRERALDIQDICLELLEDVSGARSKALVALKEPSAIIAENLTPQQLLGLERNWISALVLESAGTTSHTVILARSLGIPTLVGAKSVGELAPGQDVLVDANRGFLVVEGTDAVRKFYERESKTLLNRRTALASYAVRPAVTRDGRVLEVAANVSSAQELAPAFEDGADGIGLFRTEMLFLGREHAPSEEEQFEVYMQAVRAANGKPVILRTMDIGGDKSLPYLNLPQENNPFLGCRGVRVYAEHQSLLEAQLRAILRASAFGRIQLMVPMVSAVDEILWMKAKLAEVQVSLCEQRISFDPAMPVGIMIEVPSVAFVLDQLCRELDFFSIGTNDLSQYFLAVDRDNSRVSALSNVRHPGFLSFLEQIVTSVHKHGKWVGMCGDMAADLRNLPLLVALGLDEISVPAAEIPIVKERIARLSVPDCQKLLLQATACQRARDVESCLDNGSNEASRSLLDRNLVLLDAKADTKEEAIREIVDAFYVGGRTDEPDRLEEAIWTRESVYSTGLGHSFAVPHCKTDAINASSIGILKLPRPIDWDAVDGKPVEFVILLAARESNSNGAHLRVFSKLARNLMNEEFREQLLQARDQEALLAKLKQEFDEPESSPQSRMR